MMDYNRFIRIYAKKHCVCPNCYSKNYSCTLAGFIYDPEHPENYKDKNQVDCLNCGWTGIKHDLIPEINPGESVWTYKKNGKKYKVISENAKMKEINTGEWIDCVIYAPLYENEFEMFSREKNDFYEKFKKESR